MEYLALGEVTISNVINFMAIVVVIAVSRSVSKFVTKKCSLLLDMESKARKHFASRLDTVQGVNDILDSLICDCKCERVSLLEFHNGGTNICGLPFAKISCTHERCSIGVKLASFNIKDYPIALFGYVVAKALSTKLVMIESLDSLKATDASTYQFWTESGAKALCIRVVRNLNDMPLGILVLEFNRSLSLGTSELDKVTRAAYAVGVLHSFKESDS